LLVSRLGRVVIEQILASTFPESVPIGCCVVPVKSGELDNVRAILPEVFFNKQRKIAFPIGGKAGPGRVRPLLVKYL